MNWNFSVSLLPMILVIILLTLIYKKREEDENYLVLKLIGYFFLGTFNFNLNGIIIPIGIIIYFAFMRPAMNPLAKRYAAVFGVIMMVIGAFLSQI